MSSLTEFFETGRDNSLGPLFRSKTKKPRRFGSDFGRDGGIFEIDRANPFRMLHVSLKNLVKVNDFLPWLTISFVF